MRDTGYFILLLVTSLMNGVSQIFMRWGGMRSAASTATSRLQWVYESRWWLVGLALGWVCGLGWAWSLRKLPLSFALPIYVGLAYAFAILGEYVILKEKVNVLQAVGIVTVLFGIILITSNSH